jgi:hypothetical protein
MPTPPLPDGFMYTMQVLARGDGEIVPEALLRMWTPRIRRFPAESTTYGLVWTVPVPVPVAVAWNVVR